MLCYTGARPPSCQVKKNWDPRQKAHTFPSGRRNRPPPLAIRPPRPHGPRGPFGIRVICHRRHMRCGKGRCGARSPHRRRSERAPPPSRASEPPARAHVGRQPLVALLLVLPQLGALQEVHLRASFNGGRRVGFGGFGGAQRCRHAALVRSPGFGRQASPSRLSLQPLAQRQRQRQAGRARRGGPGLGRGGAGRGRTRSRYVLLDRLCSSSSSSSAASPFFSSCQSMRVLSSTLTCGRGAWL